MMHQSIAEREKLDCQLNYGPVHYPYTVQEGGSLALASYLGKHMYIPSRRSLAGLQD